MDNDKTTNILAIAMSQIRLPDTRERMWYNSRYVRYGEDNLFDFFLENLRDSAPLHNAILTSKTEQAFGEGLSLETNNLRAKLFTARCNPKEGVEDIYFKCLQDKILYGGFYIEVIWGADGRIAEIYHLPFGKIRAARKDPETRQIKAYFYCENWFKQYQLGYTEIPIFDPENRRGRQILACHSYVAGREYYPLPDYTAALSYIALEKEIANYGLSEIRNSFGGSNMINFKNGIPSEEEQQAIKHRIQEQLTASDNAGKLLVTFSPNPDTTPDISPIQTSNAADKYLQVEKSVLQNVLSAHRVVSPLLVGIRSEGNGLGSNANEIENAFELWNNTVIKPYQSKVLKALNMLAMWTPNYDGWKWEATTIQPITFTYGENVLTQILTTNELREKIGYEALKNGDSIEKNTQFFAK